MEPVSCAGMNPAYPCGGLVDESTGRCEECGMVNEIPDDDDYWQSNAPDAGWYTNDN